MEYNGIFILFKGQIYSKQGSHISFLFGIWTYFKYISWCLDEAQVSTVNTNLIKFVGVQCFHKTIKWIMCFWRGLAILCLHEHCWWSKFPLTSYRFSLVQQFLSCLPRIKSRQYILISSGKRFLPLKLPTACWQEKSSQKNILLTWLI